eukprot:5544066-Pyramimonas_sp.AAC.1
MPGCMQAAVSTVAWQSHRMSSVRIAKAVNVLGFWSSANGMHGNMLPMSRTRRSRALYVQKQRAVRVCAQDREKLTDDMEVRVVGMVMSCLDKVLLPSFYAMLSRSEI